MEDIHKPFRRAWIDHALINVQDYLQSYKDSFAEYIPVDNRYFEDPTFFAEERIACSLESMRCDFQDRVEPTDNLIVPDGVSLDTLRYQSEDLKKRKLRKYFCAYYANMKYSNYPPHQTVKVDLSKFKHAPVKQPDVALIVQIHAPERRLDSKVVKNAKMPLFHVDQEFLVLGDQYLTELRDVIDCTSDLAIPGEFSDCPDPLPSITCKDIYKSGFFYINGVFYNDMRDKNCRDYSEPIIKWSKDRGIGPFKKALMEKSRFIDLTIHLGYPYVYVHQGECEHIIIFTDLRLVSNHDVNNRNAYPLYTQIKPSKRIFCMVCHCYTAMWVVYDNKRLPENPFFFCKKCFFSFNYDSNNQKIGEFRAYHFPDHSKLF